MATVGHNGERDIRSPDSKQPTETIEGAQGGGGVERVVIAIIDLNRPQSSEASTSRFLQGPDCDSYTPR